MTYEQILLKLQRQGPANEATMLRALQLSAVEYARWLKNDHEYSEETFGNLGAWALGQYGYDNNTGTWKRTAVRSTKVEPLNVKPEPAKPDSLKRRGMVAFQGALSGGTTEAQRPPEGASKADILRLREREAAEAKKNQSLLARAAQALKPAKTLTMQEAMAQPRRQA